jgi:hypothetical protein
MTRKNVGKKDEMNRYKVCEMILIWALLLGGCAPGMPIGSAELLPLSQQQVVTGAYRIYTGQQPIYWEFVNASGLRILFWPGATTGRETLINMICLESCAAGWERIVSGYAMTATRASGFAAHLRNSPFWQEVTAAAPVAVSWAARMYAGIATGGTTEFLVVPAGFQLLIPEEARS